MFDNHEKFMIGLLICLILFFGGLCQCTSRIEVDSKKSEPLHLENYVP